MTDVNIDINYAKENEEFDMNSMKDDLISVEEEEEIVFYLHIYQEYFVIDNIFKIHKFIL